MSKSVPMLSQEKYGIITLDKPTTRSKAILFDKRHRIVVQLEVIIVAKLKIC